MPRIAMLVAAGVLTLAAGMPASAGTILDDLNSKGLTVTIGAFGMSRPNHEGSSKDIFAAAPIFNIRPVGTPARFFNPREGFGVTLFDIGRLQIGPVGNLQWERRVKDDPYALQGLGDVKFAVEVGGFADYWFTDWLRYRAEVRQGFGGHHGVVVDQFVDIVVPYGQWTFSAGPRMRIATAAANRPYFDVSFAQSVASGLPVYDTGGGIRSVGGGGQATYRFNPQWALHGFVEYDRLVSDVANAPVVRLRGDRDQWTFGAGVAYSFDWVR